MARFLDEQLERLKREVSLVRLVESYGVMPMTRLRVSKISEGNLPHSGHII